VQPAPDADFPELGELEDTLMTMHRSVFDHLKPLDGGAARARSREARGASAGLTDDMTSLSVRERNGSSNSSDLDGSGDGDDEDGKPTISFACLIGMAILASPEQRLTVSEIYGWMKASFPYFTSATVGSGWKNSVRHNLSLNKHFVRLSRDPDDHLHGKGSYWTIRPESVPAMEAAIRKQEGGWVDRSCAPHLGFTADVVKPVDSPKRRAQRPKAEPSKSKRAAKRSTAAMDDEAAASMLCSLGVADDAAPGDSSTSSLPTALPFGTNGLVGQSLHGVSGNIHQRATPLAAQPKASGKKTSLGVSSTFTFAQQAQGAQQKQPRGRADMSSASAHHQARGPVFPSYATPATPTFVLPHHAADGVKAQGGVAPRALTTAGTRPFPPSATTTSAGGGGERKMFTFSAAPASFGAAALEFDRRYTPEGPSTLTRAAPEGAGDEFTASPFKTRRRLTVGERRTEQDASAAAALLGLAGTSMTLCS